MRQVNAFVSIEWMITIILHVPDSSQCLLRQFVPVRNIVEDSWSRMAET